MSGPRVYLAGSITGKTRREAEDWRWNVSRALKTRGITTIDPLRDLDDVLPADPDAPIAISYDASILAGAEMIGARSFNDVARCDLLLANLLGEKHVSRGTLMEIGAAKALGKLIVVAMEPLVDNPHNHPLVLYAATMVLLTLDDAILVAANLLS